MGKASLQGSNISFIEVINNLEPKSRNLDWAIELRDELTETGSEPTQLKWR